MAIQLFKELIDENGHLEIPEGVRKILPNTLMNCEKLTSVSIIGPGAFEGCSCLNDDDRSLIVAKESVHDVLDISTTAILRE